MLKIRSNLENTLSICHRAKQTLDRTVTGQKPIGARNADKKPMSSREYETVGYVIAGRAELHVEGQMVLLEAGDSWLVPAGASHTYKILDAFTAVEATSPPYHVHGRDD